MSGMCSQWAPRSKGTPKVLMSVTQRPPTAAPASTKAMRSPEPDNRRAAAMPAAPAPTITTSRGPGREGGGADLLDTGAPGALGAPGAGAFGAASPGAAVTAAADAARKDRRLSFFMVAVAAVRESSSR